MRARFEPLLDHLALGLADAGGVVHGHDARDHGLLVHGLGVGGHALGRIQAHVFHLHLLAMAHVAALRQDGL